LTIRGAQHIDQLLEEEGNADKILSHIAESFVNAFLGSRYFIPLVTEPLITQCTADIAIYKLLEDRAPRIPDFAQARYTNVVSILMMLRDGDMTLSSSQTMITSGDQEVWSNVFSTPPAFQSAEQYVSSSCISSINNMGLF
jgi:phage gp36-like protein